MKPITIHVSEPLYREYQRFAKQHDRKTSQLIREAMELFRDQKMRRPKGYSLRDIKGISVGKILKPWTSRSEMLEDFFDGRD